MTPGELADETQLSLVSRLHRMADEVANLQSEIAAVEAIVTDPPGVQSSLACTAERPGAGWKPTPTPQPWLEARTA
jgi:hypothetical protein